MSPNNIIQELLRENKLSHRLSKYIKQIESFTDYLKIRRDALPEDDPIHRLIDHLYCAITDEKLDVKTVLDLIDTEKGYGSALVTAVGQNSFVARDAINGYEIIIIGTDPRLWYAASRHAGSIDDTIREKIIQKDEALWKSADKAMEDISYHVMEETLFAEKPDEIVEALEDIGMQRPLQINYLGVGFNIDKAVQFTVDVLTSFDYHTGDVIEINGIDCNSTSLQEKMVEFADAVRKKLPENFQAELVFNTYPNTFQNVNSFAELGERVDREHSLSVLDGGTFGNMDERALGLLKKIVPSYLLFTSHHFEEEYNPLEALIAAHYYATPETGSVVTPLLRGLWINEKEAVRAFVRAASIRPDSVFFRNMKVGTHYIGEGVVVSPLIGLDLANPPEALGKTELIPSEIDGRKVYLTSIKTDKYQKSILKTTLELCGLSKEVYRVVESGPHSVALPNGFSLDPLNEPNGFTYKPGAVSAYLIDTRKLDISKVREYNQAHELPSMIW